ncbi:hypothetical protein HA62_10450 [Pseudomonas putida]|nr:hypothetical protein HA62_10450 [Pseudomonas putida]
MSAALMNHRLKDISPAQAVEPAAGKVGTTRRSFLRFRFFGYFALGDEALDCRNDYFLCRLRQYRPPTVVNDVFLIRHGMHSLCNDD